MTVDSLQLQLDERIRATSANERMRLHARMAVDARRLVWAQADRAGPMSEIDRARFLLRRLYPDLEGPRLDAILRELEAAWRAGRWQGFQRPSPPNRALEEEPWQALNPEAQAGDQSGVSSPALVPKPAVQALPGGL